jgi:hypothetical protein
MARPSSVLRRWYEEVCCFAGIDSLHSILFSMQRPKHNEQVSLTLDIGLVESVSFFVSGKNTVHLSGYVYWYVDDEPFLSKYFGFQC